MVQHWISLINNRIHQPCINTKVTKIFSQSNSFFYGDYELDVYLASKGEYTTLESVLNRVISKSDGWIYCCHNLPWSFPLYNSFASIIYEFGDIDSRCFKMLFPKKEKNHILGSIQVRKDGNFKLIACESQRYYYVFCFATS